MLNQRSIQAITASVYSEAFIKPLYESYCYSNIPQTIKNIFTNQPDGRALPPDVFGVEQKSYEKVILLLVDGFGWNVLEEYKDSIPFLNRFEQAGVLSMLTTQYPSATANQITTIHTGLPSGQHGNYEWFHYDPHVDAMIAPLLFSFAGKKEHGTLKNSGITPSVLYPRKTLYKDLATKGIPSSVFIDKEFSHTPYNSCVTEGASVYPFTTLEEGLQQLRTKVLSDHGAHYYYVYTNSIDSAAHKFGVKSSECYSAVKKLFTALETVLNQGFANHAKSTLFLLTADHGHHDIDPNTTIYLNKQFPQILPWLETNKEGKFLVPAGTARNMYLSVKQEFVEEAYAFLKEHLKESAEVYKVEDMITNRLFGLDEPSEDFLERVGNIAILSNGSGSVWWYEKDIFEITYKSHHGSLTKEEVQIPFGCLYFS